MEQYVGVSAPWGTQDHWNVTDTVEAGQCCIGAQNQSFDQGLMLGVGDCNDSVSVHTNEWDRRVRRMNVHECLPG